MYQKAGLGLVSGGAGALAYTGVDVVWLVLAAFAIIAAGAALLRIAPKRAAPRRAAR